METAHTLKLYMETKLSINHVISASDDSLVQIKHHTLTQNNAD